MKDRFTHESDVGCRNISASERAEVYRRDDFTCLYCTKKLIDGQLSIDHLVPVSRGGLDEITNYVTCCRSCNSRKKDLPLEQFALRIGIEVEDIPVHGDPVIDNESLPIQIRLLRKRIFDKARKSELNFNGKSYQKKLEKAFRREFWTTPEGHALECEFPTLPGHVRVMLPEIQTIARTAREYLLLVELAKSAATRNLIGTVLNPDCDVFDALARLQTQSKDEALKSRVRKAVERFLKEVRHKGS